MSISSIVNSLRAKSMPKSKEYFQVTKDANGKILELCGETRLGNTYSVKQLANGNIEAKEINDHDLTRQSLDEWSSFSVVHDKDGKLIQLRESYITQPDVVVE